jgi:hypothetical protein
VEQIVVVGHEYHRYGQAWRSELANFSGDRHRKTPTPVNKLAEHYFEHY